LKLELRELLLQLRDFSERIDARGVRDADLAGVEALQVSDFDLCRDATTPEHLARDARLPTVLSISPMRVLMAAKSKSAFR
jgi:hypothetical protein